MLFEVRPDLFPQGYLCDAEVALWDLYLEGLKDRHG